MLNKPNAFVLAAVFIALVLHSDQVSGGATEEQMIAAGKLMRDVCLPKFNKVTAEVADGIREGNVPDTKDVKCYINCVMEMMQTVEKLNSIELF